MKNFFLALALAAVPAAAQADDLDQFGAAETAQRLIRNLNDLSVVARRQASTVRNPQLSNHLFQLERLSNTVALSVRQDVLRFLDRRNNPRRALRGLQALNPRFNEIDRIFNGLARRNARVGQSLQRDVNQIQRNHNRLLNQLRRGNNDRNWVGTCRVTLETVWGQDLQHFYGQAQARTELQAVSRARDEAMRQCRVQVRGLQQCNVHEPECYATVGRF